MTYQEQIQEKKARLEAIGGSGLDIWRSQELNDEASELEYQIEQLQRRAQFSALRTMVGDEAILGALTG